MFCIPILWEELIDSKCPLALPGTTVAVGLPKMMRSVRPNITTFSWQVPVTDMEFGPVAGRLARAAVIVRNAPGVAAEQSTTAPAPKAGRESKAVARIATRTPGRPKCRFMVFLLDGMRQGGIAASEL